MQFRNSKRVSFVALAALALSVQTPRASAENSGFVIAFGGEPGAPLTHSYDYGVPDGDAPSFTMRIPSIDVEVQPVLADVELTVAKAGKIVQRVHAERAYRSLNECTAARDLLAKKITALLPAAYAGANSGWQQQSADGKVGGGASCLTPRHLPFATLVFDLGLTTGR